MDDTIIYHEHGKDPMFKTWHASKRPMFIYINSNGGSIVCSEKAYPIKKGTLCFVGANKYHYTMPENTELYNRSKIFVSNAKFNKLLDIVAKKDDIRDFSNDSFIYAQIPECDMENVENIFKELNRYKDDEKYRDLVLYSCCIKLICYVDKYSVEGTASASGFMNKAIEYINDNIFDDINIEKICSEIHISKYHFCRQFKIKTGMTVMQYILKTRIVLAKNMLLNDGISVTSVSNKCGFSSVSYFSRVFKEQTGITPLKYRKKMELKQFGDGGA